MASTLARRMNKYLFEYGQFAYNLRILLNNREDLSKLHFPRERKRIPKSDNSVVSVRFRDSLLHHEKFLGIRVTKDFLAPPRSTIQTSLQNVLWKY